MRTGYVVTRMVSNLKMQRRARPIQLRNPARAARSRSLLILRCASTTDCKRVARNRFSPPARTHSPKIESVPTLFFPGAMVGGQIVEENFPFLGADRRAPLDHFVYHLGPH